jgi:orotate phosphoribosyltransferase
VLIIDDVITAGTAIRESLQLIKSVGAKAKAVAVLISLDRQERGTGAESAVQQVESEFGIPVHSIAKLEDLLEFMRDREDFQEHMKALQAYSAEFGI